MQRFLIALFLLPSLAAAQFGFPPTNPTRFQSNGTIQNPQPQYVNFSTGLTTSLAGGVLVITTTGGAPVPQTRTLTLTSPLACGGTAGATCDLSANRTLSVANQSANIVLAGPSSGGAAAPTFRALVAADIPSLSGTYLALTGGTMTGSITLVDSTTALTTGNYAARLNSAITATASVDTAVVVSSTNTLAGSDKVLSIQNPIGTERSYFDGTGNLFVPATAGMCSSGTRCVVVSSTGTGVFGGVLYPANGAFQNDVGIAGQAFSQVFTRHIVGESGAIPTIAAGAGAGTGPTVSIGAGSTDLATTVNVTTGTTATANATLATITFNTAYGSAPRMVCVPTNAVTAALTSEVFVNHASTTTTTFVLTTNATAPADSTAYQWNCMAHQ